MARKELKSLIDQGKILQNPPTNAAITLADCAKWTQDVRTYNERVLKEHPAYKPLKDALFFNNSLLLADENPTAIDRQTCSGGVRGFIAGKVCYCRCQFIGLPPATDISSAGRAYLIDKRRIAGDKSRQNDVDRNAASTDFHGKRFGKTDDPGFGCRVVAALLESDCSGDA